jgi:very-short-patch-repair endonuclease
MTSSELEALFEFQLRAVLGVTDFVREYRFHPVRKFRFDFAWPERKIAVEIDGGTWARGRHTQGAGFARDAVKNNLALMDGWRVFHFDADMVKSTAAIEFMREVFATL